MQTVPNSTGRTIYLAGHNPAAETALTAAGYDVVTPTSCAGLDDPAAHVAAADYDLDALFAADAVVMLDAETWESAVAVALGVPVLALAEIV